jgi:hypothetical protein
MNGLPAMTPVTSSNIESIAHRGTTLYVRFKGGGLYSYADVPSEVYHEFQAAESPGGFFRSKIRGTYRHKPHDA